MNACNSDEQYTSLRVLENENFSLILKGPSCKVYWTFELRESLFVVHDEYCIAILFIDPKKNTKQSKCAILRNERTWNESFGRNIFATIVLSPKMGVNGMPPLS